MTRAIASAARGEFGLSWRYHPLAILVVLQLGWFALVRLGVVAKASPKTMQRLIRANVVVFLVVWVLRWRFGLLDFVVT